MATHQEAVAFLDTHGFLPLLSSPVDLRVGIPAYAYVIEVLERAASSRAGLITIHPRYAHLDTAAGVALLGHELVHQKQFETIPGFETLYAEEAARVEQSGLPPYENVFERPAYELEAEVYRAAVDAGYPPGKHVPLLLRGGAAAAETSLVAGISRGVALGIGLGLAGMIFAVLRKAR